MKLCVFFIQNKIIEWNLVMTKICELPSDEKALAGSLFVSRYSFEICSEYLENWKTTSEFFLVVTCFEGETTYQEI